MNPGESEPAQAVENSPALHIAESLNMDPDPYLCGLLAEYVLGVEIVERLVPSVLDSHNRAAFEHGIADAVSVNFQDLANLLHAVRSRAPAIFDACASTKLGPESALIDRIRQHRHTKEPHYKYRPIMDYMHRSDAKRVGVAREQDA